MRVAGRARARRGGAGGTRAATTSRAAQLRRRRLPRRLGQELRDGRELELLRLRLRLLLLALERARAGAAVCDEEQVRVCLPEVAERVGHQVAKAPRRAAADERDEPGEDRGEGEREEQAEPDDPRRDDEDDAERRLPAVLALRLRGQREVERIAARLAGEAGERVRRDAHERVDMELVA